MRKPLKPTSIKFTTEQRRYLKRLARQERHGKLSLVVKRMVDREIQLSVPSDVRVVNA